MNAAAKIPNPLLETSGIWQKFDNILKKKSTALSIGYVTWFTYNSNQILLMIRFHQTE